MEGKKLEILHVDDDADLGRALGLVLQDICIIEFHSSSTSGLKAFEERLVSGNRPDLMILDFMMPDMDGPALCKRIREIEKDHLVDAVKIIILSALTNPLHVREAFEAGCDAFLNKPVHKNNLLDEIRKLGLLA
ncbi:MAG: response regulator [Planctomycetes bacterium]|nr:response regulator [Planctomycetota bacterium]